MHFDTFWSDLIATITGGIVLAALFFWFRERVFPLPKITGRWYFEMRTLNTSYRPYENMVLRYVAMVWCEGSRIEGTVEKIFENSSTPNSIHNPFYKGLCLYCYGGITAPPWVKRFLA